MIKRAKSMEKEAKACKARWTKSDAVALEAVTQREAVKKVQQYGCLWLTKH